MTVARKVLSVALSALCVVVLILGLGYAGMRKAGLEAEPVMSGSMAPTMPVGSLAIMKPVPASSVEVGDVITFRRPGDKTLITHRIAAIRHTDKGTIYRTKGDAVDVRDPWRLKAADADATVGKVVTDVPYAGYVLNYAGRSDTRLVVMWALAALLLLYVLRHIWRRDPEQPATDTGHEAVASR